MEDYGWIKLHRKLLDNPLMQDAKLLQLFIYCILKANHKPNDFIFNDRMISVERGTFITGRFELAKDLKMNPSLVYKNLKKLKLLGYISLNSNNKFTMLTVLKYDTYQSVVTAKEQQSNNKVTTKEQQSNNKVTQTRMNKNEENDNNEKKESLPLEKAQAGDFIDSIILLFQECYKHSKGIEYISVGKGKQKYNYKDRNAAGSLLKYIKGKYPDETSEMTLKRFGSLFNKCFTINDTWLSNNMTLDTISNKLNNIILYGQNGNKEPGKNGVSISEHNQGIFSKRSTTVTG